MSEQTSKFGDIVGNKKEFHASKQAIALNLVNTNKIVVFDKFFVTYLHDDDDGDDDDDDVIRPLCIILHIIYYILHIILHKIF